MNGTPVSALIFAADVGGVLRDAAERQHRLVGGIEHAAQRRRDCTGSSGLTGIRPCTVTRSTVGSAQTTLQISANFGACTPTCRADVERILRREAGIDHGGQLRARLGRQRRHLGALVAGVVEHEALGAAGIADHGDAVALRQAALRQRQAGLGQIVERRAAQDAVFPANRVEHRVVARDRAGVAHRRRLAALAAPDLDDEDRLFRGQRLLGRRHEGLRPADAFDHAGDDLGVLVLDQEIDVVGEIEIELVAARYRIGEIEAAQRRLLQPELERAAGLEHDADRARPSACARAWPDRAGASRAAPASPCSSGRRCEGHACRTRSSSACARFVPSASPPSPNCAA